MTLTAPHPTTSSPRENWPAATALPPSGRRLRTKELTLLSALATGAPISVVASLLGVSDRTIRRRVRTVCEQIGVNTPIEAVAWAARRRLI